MLRLVHASTDPDGSASDVPALDLDELCRLAAREMLALAPEAERRAYLDARVGALDATGRRPVAGNGYAQPREVTTGAGMVAVSAPRVDSAIRSRALAARSFAIPIHARLGDQDVDRILTGVRTYFGAQP